MIMLFGRQWVQTAAYWGSCTLGECPLYSSVQWLQTHQSQIQQLDHMNKPILSVEIVPSWKQGRLVAIIMCWSTGNCRWKLNLNQGERHWLWSTSTFRKTSGSMLTQSRLRHKLPEFIGLFRAFALLPVLPSIYRYIFIMLWRRKSVRLQLT